MHIEHLFKTRDSNKGKIVNLLIFLTMSMMWASQAFSKTIPSLVMFLGTLICITLTYLSICQTSHIAAPGDTITHLCVSSPFKSRELEDELSESGHHWN